MYQVLNKRKRLSEIIIEATMSVSGKRFNRETYSYYTNFYTLSFCIPDHSFKIGKFIKSLSEWNFYIYVYFSKLNENYEKLQKNCQKSKIILDFFAIFFLPLHK